MSFILSSYNTAKELSQGTYPIPYTLRDVSAILRGLLLYNYNTTTFMDILYYETRRVLIDRIGSSDLKAKIENSIREHIVKLGPIESSNLKDGEPVFVSWTVNPNDEMNFNDQGTNPNGQAILGYCEASLAKKIIESALVKFRREHYDIVLTLVPGAVQWVAWCNRVLSRPGGHLLLVGDTGVGLIEAATISAYMLRFTISRLFMTRNYLLKNFRNDIKSVISRCVYHNEFVFLLIEDYQLVDESFMEVIHSFMATSDPGVLCGSDEIELLLGGLKEEAGAEGCAGSLRAFLVRRVERNLRVCVALSPLRPSFLSALRCSPAAGAVWAGGLCAGDMAAHCAAHLGAGLGAVAPGLVGVGGGSPQGFRHLVGGCRRVHAALDRRHGAALARLRAGLATLADAARSVDRTRRDLHAAREACRLRQREADAAMAQISAAMAASAEQRAAAVELEAALAREQGHIAQRKAELEAELGTVLPTMEDAKQAVRGIRTEHLNEIRALRAPPDAIKDVLEGVLGLLGITDSSWNGMKKFLGERGVVQRIVDFSPDQVRPEVGLKIEKFIKQRSNSFTLEIISRASSAAAPLSTWCKAVVSCSKVMARVNPLREALSHLETNKEAGEHKLKDLEQDLRDIDTRVSNLRTEFESKIKEAEWLQDELMKSESQLEVVEALLHGLDTEKSRWSKQMEEMLSLVEKTPRIALIASAFIVFLGNESEEKRLEYFEAWKDYHQLETFDFVQSMRTESQVLTYISQDLSNDNLSIQNAIILLDTAQTPLIIDPSSQAYTWIRNYTQSNKLIVEGNDNEQRSIRSYTGVSTKIWEDTDCNRCDVYRATTHAHSPLPLHYS